MVLSNYFPTTGIPTGITDHSATFCANFCPFSKFFEPGSLISIRVWDVVIVPGSDHLSIICSFKSLSNRSGSGEKK